MSTTQMVKEVWHSVKMFINDIECLKIFHADIKRTKQDHKKGSMDIPHNERNEYYNPSLSKYQPKKYTKAKVSINMLGLLNAINSPYKVSHN